MSLFRPPPLTELELAVLAQVGDLQERLRYLVHETRGSWEVLLRRVMRARAIRGSNSIEGYNISEDDALAAAAGDQPVDASDEVWRNIEGYTQALSYVLAQATDPHFHYSTDLIRALHFMLISHDGSKNPGKWRPGAIYVRNDERRVTVYEGPAAGAVPSLMDEFIRGLTNDEARDVPPIVRAAMAHLNLTMIHPFSDGNGRMARCVQTLVLARSGGPVSPEFASIEEYLGENRRAYYDVLAEVGMGQWHPERDARPWIRFCLRAHFTQAHTLHRRAREMDHLWGLLEERLAAASLPPRLIFALSDAAFGFRVRNATYRGVAEVSDQVASRDLKLAVDSGLLVAKGERRGRSYFASADVLAIRARIREPKDVPDPFALALRDQITLPLDRTDP